MKTRQDAVCLLAGNSNATSQDICRSLAKEGISAIVVQKEADAPEAEDTSRQWSGQPGKDLFFNGWKLLF
ncbi:hypothetical protein ACFSUS_04165 [Spirosoma soli]|uniref:Uncharacterized protein n=1 Tax=Spirosoma soli TaxID=1770529 RepID=A0ABW5LYX1_9BACT